MLDGDHVSVEGKRTLLRRLLSALPGHDHLNSARHHCDFDGRLPDSLPIGLHGQVGTGVDGNTALCDIVAYRRFLRLASQDDRKSQGEII